MNEHDDYPGDDVGLDLDPRCSHRITDLYNGLALAPDIDDVWIVTHGYSGFDYTAEVIPAFARYKNVIWSTWVDTPPAIKEQLEASGMVCLFNEYPAEKGKSTLNYQRTAFVKGCEEAKRRGAAFVYKVRNDFDIVNLDRLMARLKWKYQQSGKIQMLCWDNISNGLCDYCCGASPEHLLEYWSFPDINCASERELIAQYFKLKGLPYDYRYKTASQLIETYIRELDRLGICINRFKWIEESPLQSHFSNPAVYC